ncbi:transposase [Dactylosporangium sp. NPDC049525]|uniref:transposase n=1 Tax=Dactylosporangium sp. NPDC049525 TaxID=3154730 RepID=UPI003421EEE8
MLAVDVSPWLRPDAATARTGCSATSTAGPRCRAVHSRLAVIVRPRAGRSSCFAILDAVRLGPHDDVAEVTAVQVRAVAERLIATGQWQAAYPDVLVVFDAATA